MVRTMRPEDWPRVEYIYKQGIERGTSTFTTECPNYEQWNQTYKKDCRFVYEVDGVVAGFVAISPVSSKPHYSGVAEVCIYVDEAYWRQGIGVALLNQLCEAAFGQGYWMLYSSIFSDNIASIELHKKCGFRLIGYREKIAKNRFFSVLIGSVFDIKDIICYAVGTILIVVGQRVYDNCRKHSN